MTDGSAQSGVLIDSVTCSHCEFESFFVCGRVSIAVRFESGLSVYASCSSFCVSARDVPSENLSNLQTILVVEILEVSTRNVNVTGQLYATCVLPVTCITAGSVSPFGPTCPHGPLGPVGPGNPCGPIRLLRAEESRSSCV